MLSSDSSVSSDSSDSDFVGGFARSNAIQYQERRNNGNVGDPRNRAGPSGVRNIAPRRPPQAAGIARRIVRNRMMPIRPPQRRERNRLLPPEQYELSDWFTQEMPQNLYFPQIGDNVVYLRQGHEIYLSIVKKKYPRYLVPSYPLPWDRLTLSTQEYCQVLGVQFVLEPSRMSKITLCLMKDKLPLGNKFTIYYHPIQEARDFLVLSDIYDLCSGESWRIGQRFRCAMPNNTWRRGMIMAIDPLDQQFPESPFLRYRVRWDDDTVGRISSWDLSSNNQESTISSRDATIQVQREELDAWQRVFRGVREWPLGDRETFLAAIAPELEMLLDLRICEPFVDAHFERTDPVYLNRIAYPVDLGLILLRLDSGFYRRLSSMEFDINHMIRNAFEFYPSNHIFTKIVRLSTDLLFRIIRVSRRSFSLRITYNHLPNSVEYHDSDTEEHRQNRTRKKKLKRVTTPRFPLKCQVLNPQVNSQARPYDENRPRILREILYNEMPSLLSRDQQRMIKFLYKTGVLKKGANTGVHNGQKNRKVDIVYVDWTGDNRFPKRLPERDRDRRIRPVAVVRPSGPDENHLSPSHSQEHNSDSSQPLALLKAKRNDENQPLSRFQENDENHPSASRSQQCGSDSSQSLMVLKSKRNNENQPPTSHHQEPENIRCRAKESSREKDENIENHPPSSRPRGYDNRNNSSRVVLRASENDGSQPPMSRQECGTFEIKKECRLQDRPIRRFIPPVIIECNRTRVLQRESKKKDTRLHVVLDKRNIKLNRPPYVHGHNINPLNECQHQEHVRRPPEVVKIDWNELSINRSQEHDRTPSVLLEINQNQPSSNRSQERNRRPPLFLEIDQNQPSTSKERSGATTDHCQRSQGSDDHATPIRKFSNKRPIQTSSSTSTSSSDLDSPVFSTYKSTPKRAKIYKISKMKEWRADCLRVLQTLREDEDAAMFRESAMENHRRSVIEWVNLEYIMDVLKCGAYKDPNEVVDEVHTMLLHGRSLISAGNENIARIIDKLSLWFDELIDPVLRKWNGLNVKGEKEEKQECKGETESDLTIDEVTSSSSAMPESTTSQSPL